MKSTRFWVGAGIAAVVLVMCSISIPFVAILIYGLVNSNPDRDRWDKSPQFVYGELVTPFLSPAANAERKHAFADPASNGQVFYLPAYIYRSSDHNAKKPIELDCKGVCKSGRVPLLSLQPGKDCIYSQSDFQNENGAPDLNIVHRCAAAPLSVITRPDGKIQWAYKGYPLYYYPKDDHRIEPGWVKVEPAYYNSQGILVNFEGKTLYVRRDANVPLARSQCRSECQGSMIPFTTQFPFVRDGDTHPWFMEGMSGNDGHPASNNVSQWRINGQFLYLHKNDLKPGDQNAVSASRGYWQTVKRQTPPFYGQVSLRERGRRLQLRTYADQIPVYVFDAKYADSRECADSCLNDFIPYLKSSSRESWAGPLDAITIKKNKSGREQWAYNNKFMYIPKFNSGKSKIEFNQSAVRFGLKTIVVDTCYLGESECEKNLKVNVDRVYWRSAESRW